MKLKVSVIGQGYVGLPLSITLAESGFSVWGVDVNPDLVSQLNQGTSHVEDIDTNRINQQLVSGNYQATTDYSVITNTEVIVVCVPTPLLEDRNPDLSYLLNSVKSISERVKPGTLLIIESTVAPGTTRNLLVPTIEKQFGSITDRLHIAFSPERVDPQNQNWNLSNTPKLIAGLTPKSKKMAVDFYSSIVANIVECDSVEVVETAKLLENTFRLINISFINEFRIFCDLLDIDIEEVIKLAATKPYGFMPFYPSLGIGGHCIPVDPLYLSHKAKEIGAPSRFIDLADEINHAIPGYFVSKADKILNGLLGRKILIVGLAYKPNVSDVRETPVIGLITELRQKGAQVLWHDDLVKEWAGEKSSLLSKEYDLAIIATPHDYLDLHKLGDTPILNTRGSGN